MEVETKIMSMLDIFTILGLILSSIVAILTIIASFTKIKWKALFPRFRLKAKLKKYVKIRSNEEEEKKKAKEIVSLLFKARKRFEYKDFVYDVEPKGDGNIVVKVIYEDFKSYRPYTILMDNQSENEYEDFESLNFIFKNEDDISNLQLWLDSAINYANTSVNEYVQLRRMYLEVNLTLMIVVTGILAIFFPLLIEYTEANTNYELFSFTIILMLIYFFIAGGNVIYNLCAHKTRFEKLNFLKKLTSDIKNYFNPDVNAGSWRTNRFFKGNVPKKYGELRSHLFKYAKNFGFISLKNNSDENKLKEDISRNDAKNNSDVKKLKEDLLRNDVKNLYILLWYQRKYYIHALWTRRLNLYSIISLGVYLVIFFIIINGINV